MSSTDDRKSLQNSITEKLDTLNKVMPQIRKLEDQARSLKAEIATLNVKLATAEPNKGAGDLAHLAEVALASW